MSSEKETHFGNQLRLHEEADFLRESAAEERRKLKRGTSESSNVAESIAKGFEKRADWADKKRRARLKVELGIADGTDKALAVGEMDPKGYYTTAEVVKGRDTVNERISRTEAGEEVGPPYGSEEYYDQFHGGEEEVQEEE